MSFKNNRQVPFRVLACVTAAAEQEHCFSVDVPQLLLQPGAEGALEVSFCPDREGEFIGTLVLCKDNQVFQFRLTADAAAPVQHYVPSTEHDEDDYEAEGKNEESTSQASVHDRSHECAGEQVREQSLEAVREQPSERIDDRNATVQSDATSSSSTFSDISLDLRHEWLKQWVEQRKHQMNGTRDTSSQFAVLPLSVTLQAIGCGCSDNVRFAGDILVRNFAAEQLELQWVTSSPLIRILSGPQSVGPHDDCK